MEHKLYNLRNNLLIIRNEINELIEYVEKIQIENKLMGYLKISDIIDYFSDNAELHNDGERYFTTSISDFIIELISLEKGD